MILSLHNKPYFLFQNVLKNGLSINIALENDIFCIFRKGGVLFPKNMILFTKCHMKDYIFQKNTWKYNIFSKCYEKIVFSKKSHRCFFNFRKVFFCFFFWKFRIFSFDGKRKMVFIRKYLEIRSFLYIKQKWHVFFVQIWYYSSVKKANMVFFRKNTFWDDIFSIIENDDIHPTKYGIFVKNVIVIDFF